MTFTQELWEETLPIYQEILEHPFNQELIAGTLSRDRFAFYIQQDRLYLDEFGRALAVLGGRCPRSKDVPTFLEFASGVFVVEQALHDEYFARFGVNEPTEHKTPSCLSYTSFLLATTTHGEYREGLAAVLPCFWVYREVGNFIHARANPGNPYQQWIDTYASPEFSASVDAAIALTDNAAAHADEFGRGRMRSAFVTSVRLEWMFWDSAYRMETWQSEV